ncbi:YadA-like family protein [Escherichia coli]|uniref:Putative hemagglutinin/invasin n=1 Tax=Escherichia coli O83:H1 (strain NRG 857C / AIEC) TaxID=685038 RepID=A0A0H3EQG6_ECO8N|nr:YadA-like family protein [Escherichia coli]ADR28992.1 putative hemagglutinin/invasin [Escherichia coli O83:H1 str. NRG 857C]KAF3709056.1 trimeric autotransporter adhesin [Escherichia coli]UIM83735.1 YadA-like family protein [Escherichia coli LF82]CAP78058.1 adhesin [Escherichia coli LF82]SQM77372.1 adhesin [Escherichia coli]
MNKIFKVIWNPATGSYTVASETAKSRGKKSGRSKLLISALVAGGLLSSFGASAELALDGGEGIESPIEGHNWIAIGEYAKATTKTISGMAMAIGLQAVADGEGSTAFGYQSHSSGDRAIAIGQVSNAAGNRSTAFGSGANAIGDYSLALGGTTYTGGIYSTAIGRGSRVEDGADYAASLGYKAKAAGMYSLAFGSEAEANALDSVALGRLSLASAANAIAMGADSSSSNDNAIAIGNKTQALGVNSMALGNASQASGESSIALGSTSEASEQNAIALGQGSIASKVNSIALGSNSLSSGENAIALGEGSAAGGSNSLAFGSQSRANGNDSVALGVGAAAATDNSVAIGAGSTTDASNTVSVGNSATKRKIVNMAAGAISNTSTDAINGSQLYTISDSVAKRLGGGATVGSDGTVTAVSYALRSGTYNNVGDALSGIDNNTLQWNKTAGAFSANHGANATNKITNVAKGTVSATSTDVVNGSQLYDLQQDALLWNGTAFSAAHGTEATSKITNVEDGTISDTSKDAVNGSQLKETKDDVATNTANIADNTADIATNTANIADNTADISTNTTDIATNTANIADNTADIATNTTDIATNTANIADNTADIATNTTDIATNTANIADNTADIATNTTDIATNTANIADNTADIATNTTDIATNTADIATNASSITTLNADVDTLEKDALLWNGTAFSAKHGVDGADSKITNVAAGSLADDSTDAVNGAQLKATNDSIAIMGDTISDIEDDALLWDGSSFSAKHGTKGDNSKITNLLAGTVSSDSTDAINGSQLYGVADSFTSYLGGGADISDTGVLSGPTYTIGGTDYTNVGDALAAINTSFSTSLGDALLWDATAGKFSAKHGINNAPSVITDVANGAVSSTSSDAINGSQLYGVSDYIADALGGNAVVNTDGSITTPTYAIAGGSYNNVGDALEAIDTTLDDALLWDTTANGGNGAFSAAHGKDKTASVITNVANGAVSATSRDAINGSQLYSTNKYIADALGGDAEVNADGSITAPTYTIANTDYNNVGEALDALDNNALLWDEDAGAYNASHDGNASKITNVAAGDLSTTSTDAVNGSQLNATNILVTQNSQMINQLAGNTSETYIEDNGAGINYVRTNDSGLAFNDASAAGIGSTAVGYNSVADGDNSVAIGHGSNSIVETSIALGSESVSSRVIVKGSRNTSVSEEGVVIGYDTTDGELLGALSIGDDGKYRQIINVADGSEAHDAVTVRQLQNAIGAVATTPTKYYHANSTAEDSLAVGEDSLAMGAKTIVNGNAGIGIGLNTLVLADAINGIAIGSNARANHADSIAMGNGSQTTRGAQTNYTAYNMDAPQNSVGEFSVGSEDGQRQITNVAAGSADTDAVNVGQLKVTDAQVSQNTQSITNLNTQVTNLDTRVTNIENGIGDIVTTGSTKYFKTNTDGADANAQGKDSVAIGSGSIAAADNSVALGTGSVADEENTISVGSSTNQRRITNVAAGVNATDAVNVSQLKSSEAGGVRYDTKADGSIDYSNITLGGGNGGTTRISNVSAGVNNNDAVNYAQLKQSVQETKQYTDQRMVEMDNKLSKTESKLSGGIASAMAMTGLPQAYTPGASMASIGGGTYNGESAVALGVSMVSANGRWVYKLQGSTNSQGEYSAALGAGIQW